MKPSNQAIENQLLSGRFPADVVGSDPALLCYQASVDEGVATVLWLSTETHPAPRGAYILIEFEINVKSKGCRVLTQRLKLGLLFSSSQVVMPFTHVHLVPNLN